MKHQDVAEIYQGSEKGFEENYWRYLAEYYPKIAIHTQLAGVWTGVELGNALRQNINPHTERAGVLEDHANYIKSQIKAIEEL